MNIRELIEELELAGASTLPVMCQCDHGQWPENVYSVQVLYRVRGSEDDSDFQYGTLEDMLGDWDEDDLEKFVMIN